VPHHLILAQAALESGWGQRQITRENGAPSFNIFGVKATPAGKGRPPKSPPLNMKMAKPKRSKPGSVSTARIWKRSLIMSAC
jgi:uncharacterized FlgJ-related protein